MVHLRHFFFLNGPRTKLFRGPIFPGFSTTCSSCLSRLRLTSPAYGSSSNGHSKIVGIALRLSLYSHSIVIAESGSKDSAVKWFLAQCAWRYLPTQSVGYCLQEGLLLVCQSLSYVSTQSFLFTIVLTKSHHNKNCQQSNN